MTETTAAGAKFSIGPANSVANDATAYAALTYVEVGNIVDIEGAGDTFDPVTTDQLGDRRTKTLKGQKKGGTPRVVYDFDDSDTGQTNLKAAAASDSQYAIKIELDNSGGTNGSTFYARVLVMGAPITIGTANNMVRRAVQLAINSDTVEVAAA